MKKLLLSASAVALSLASMAQCNQLFISEYVVGTGNNKAYELYNPTANDIDLNGYELQRWSNGATNPVSGGTTTLAGTIPAYGTWVVANGQTEDIPLDGGFISPKCDPELQALADQLDNPYPAPTYMNGNDALILIDMTSGSSVICDIFGKPGEDPGEAWTAPDGTYITDSQTMVRKPEITGGVTAPPINFQPLLEYDTLGTDVWTNLGIHNCVCDPTSSTEEREGINISLYPNPCTSNDIINIQANYSIKSIEVFDITGKEVAIKSTVTGSNTATVDIRQFPAGTYILNVNMENKLGFSTRVIKK